MFVSHLHRFELSVVSCAALAFHLLRNVMVTRSMAIKCDFLCVHEMLTVTRNYIKFLCFAKWQRRAASDLFLLLLLLVMHKPEEMDAAYGLRYLVPLSSRSSASTTRRSVLHARTPPHANRRSKILTENKNKTCRPDTRIYGKKIRTETEAQRSRSGRNEIEENENANGKNEKNGRMKRISK